MPHAAVHATSRPDADSSVIIRPVAASPPPSPSPSSPPPAACAAPSFLADTCRSSSAFFADGQPSLPRRVNIRACSLAAAAVRHPQTSSGLFAIALLSYCFTSYCFTDTTWCFCRCHCTCQCGEPAPEVFDARCRSMQAASLQLPRSKLCQTCHCQLSALPATLPALSMCSHEYVRAQPSIHTADAFTQPPLLFLLSALSCRICLLRVTLTLHTQQSLLPSLARRPHLHVTSMSL